MNYLLWAVAVLALVLSGVSLFLRTRRVEKVIEEAGKEFCAEHLEPAEDNEFVGYTTPPRIKVGSSKGHSRL